MIFCYIVCYGRVELQLHRFTSSKIARHFIYVHAGKISLYHLQICSEEVQILIYPMHFSLQFGDLYIY